MSTFPRGFKAASGALVTTTAEGARLAVIPFQYNPASLARALQPQYFGADESARGQTVRFAYPAIQTISLDVELDAVDALEAGDALAAQYGLQPQLAALEMLVYPALSSISNSLELNAVGTIEIASSPAPATFLVWGARRVLPVRVEAFQIEEQLFDTNLNPIQASVHLEVRVLTYADLEQNSRGYAAFMAYQTVLEGLAATAGRSASGQLGNVIGLGRMG